MCVFRVSFVLDELVTFNKPLIGLIVWPQLHKSIIIIIVIMHPFSIKHEQTRSSSCKNFGNNLSGRHIPIVRNTDWALVSFSFDAL